METNLKQLSEIGYQVVWFAGSYCRACQGDRDVILRWNGERWLVL